MARTVVVVAGYLAILHHARDTLSRAGYRVVASTDLTAGFGLARLYHPVALVLQPSTQDTLQLEHTLAALRNDPATSELGVVLIGGMREATELPSMVVATAAAFETVGLLRGVQRFAALAAARLAVA